MATVIPEQAPVRFIPTNPDDQFFYVAETGQIVNWSAMNRRHAAECKWGGPKPFQIGWSIQCGACGEVMMLLRRPAA